jgi:hypothetical protein
MGAFGMEVEVRVGVQTILTPLGVNQRGKFEDKVYLVAIQRLSFCPVLRAGARAGQ